MIMRSAEICRIKKCINPILFAPISSAENLCFSHSKPRKERKKERKEGAWRRMEKIVGVFSTRELRVRICMHERNLHITDSIAPERVDVYSIYYYNAQAPNAKSRSQGAGQFFTSTQMSALLNKFELNGLAFLQKQGNTPETIFYYFKKKTRLLRNSSE